MIERNTNVCVVTNIINTSLTKSSNHSNYKFILLLRKCVYPYKCMDYCKKFNETSLPTKEDFYSHLYMEDITDSDYAHTKIFLKILKENI